MLFIPISLLVCFGALLMDPRFDPLRNEGLFFSVVVVAGFIFSSLILKKRFSEPRYDLTLTPEGIHYGAFVAQIGTDFLPWEHIASCWQIKNFLVLDIKSGKFRDSLTLGSWMKYYDTLHIELNILGGNVNKLYPQVSDGIYGRLFAETART
jgi:hypothetical protein